MDSDESVADHMMLAAVVRVLLTQPTRKTSIASILTASSYVGLAPVAPRVAKVGQQGWSLKVQGLDITRRVHGPG